MANSEHLEILKSGVDKWDAWREENEDVYPNLSGANLSEANLSGANLHRSDLFEANLSGANLFGVNLSEANLHRANLHKADLSEAKLRGTNLFGANLGEAYLHRTYLHRAYLSGAYLKRANLFGANLGEANLSETNLSEANLFGANLKEANLTGSVLYKTAFNESILNRTIFGSTNLSTCIGLNEVKVKSECVIDFQTLRNSKNIPKDFLFKIGLPETYIDYLPEFYDGRPLRLFPVFLSHSSKDKKFADKLYETLTSKRVLVWYDERKLKPGDDIREGITKGIDLYDKLIIICSENSLKNSWWVDRELDRALRKEEKLFKERGEQINTIIPITIDDYIFTKWDGIKKSDIDRYVIGDFRNWQHADKYQKAVNDLIAALNVDREDDNPISFL